MRGPLPTTGSFFGVLVGACVFASFTLIASYTSQGKDPVEPQAGSRTSANVVVQNKVVVSAHGMQEDTPLYLSTRPIPACASNGCEVPNSTIPDESILVTECFVIGTQMTNINLRVLDARSNPDGVTSSIWYLVTFNGLRGLVSEVYLTAESRGGLGLRKCAKASLP